MATINFNNQKFIRIIRKEIKDSGFEIEDLVNEYKIKRV